MSSKAVGQKYLTLLFSSILSFSTLAADIQPTPSDMGLVNQDRIEYWLKKRGELSDESNAEDRDAAYRKFINADKLNEFNRLADTLPQPYAGKSTASSAQHASQLSPESGSSQTTRVNVFAVLIEFPDYRHNGNHFGSDDTGMYYSSYPVSHYTNLLFSGSGYAGPNGQTLRSVYQHYRMASGNTFNFTGTVKGWYQAQHNAAYYGAPNGSSNDSRVPELVFEAVSQATASLSASELAQYDVKDPFDVDSDGNYSEPDGILDHVMIFHSTIGQEAGGGEGLGANAIWSHRFVVQGSGRGRDIPGTSKKVYNYTIQPIDAAVGLVAHEFGHELGLKDEYDTSSAASITGAPVGFWSLMGQGTWGGIPQGTEPTGFSPLARNQLQERLQGNWVREQVIEFSSLSESGTDFVLNEAVNTSEINQLSITLPLVNGEAEQRKYLIQLRSKNGIDAGLTSRSYEPGILIWQQNPNQTNNRVQNRSGKPMIGVIDADQNLIGNSRTRVQVRDATFSLYEQSAYPGDNQLNNNSSFQDADNYIATRKPQAGISLVSHGISINVVEQATDHSSARLRISRSGNGNQGGFIAAISKSLNSDGSMTFSVSVSGGNGDYSYQWNFGDGNTSTEAAPDHTYAAQGSYSVSVTVTDSANVTTTASRTIVYSLNPGTNNNVESSSSSGGSLGYGFILVMMLFRLRSARRLKRNNLKSAY